jgi:predicted  nucleic acid-binding Zn-ribbon protein
MDDVLAEIETLRTEIDDIKRLMLQRFRELEAYLSNIEDDVKKIKNKIRQA